MAGCFIFWNKPMELPADLFLKTVPGHDELVAFRYDFIPEGKALEDGTTENLITEVENGDLIIEGYAAVFDGIDRQGENFADGAFQRGIKSFLGGQAALCFHHQHDKVLGRVLELEEEEGKGLRMKARVDFQPEQSPLRHIYNQIKKGTINALSVGGYFKRALTEKGRRIVDMDFTEVSATAVPIHPGTKFAVVAGKALMDDLKIPEGVGLPESSEDEIREEDFLQLQFALEGIESVFSRIGRRGSQKLSNPAVL